MYQIGLYFYSNLDIFATTSAWRRMMTTLCQVASSERVGVKEGNNFSRTLKV
jgi:hypothetical protein